MRILGLGDCCVDYYIHKKMAFPGGNAFNVAVYEIGRASCRERV